MATSSSFRPLGELVSPESILLSLLLLTLSSLLLSLWKGASISTSTISYPPALKPYPILGHLPQFLSNRHRFPDWLAESLASTPTNTLVFRRPGGIRGVLTANPANVEHILRSNFENYPKGERFATLLHDFLGAGIFNADGDTWRVQRKTASFEFNTRSLRSFVVGCVQQEIECRLLPLLERSARSTGCLDFQDVLERFAFDNVCKVAFNLDPACLDPDEVGVQDKSSNFAEAFRHATNLSAGRFRYAVPRFWKIKKIFNIGSERRLRESIKIVHDFADQIIRSRKIEKNRSIENHDLLSRFMASSDSYSDEFLRDIVISFLLAGRETTSSALAWFFWLLSSRPSIEQRILDEIRSIRETKGNPRSSGFDFEDLKEMTYLHAALTESMRLYPPVPANSTAAKADDVLPDGTEVKKGWFVSYNSYAMGRIEANWGRDWAEYRPERWLEEADGSFRQESPYKFTAFHGGPRMCLGKEMAYIQMKSIVARVLERFTVEAEGKDTCPRMVSSLTLRMTDGLPVRVREREF